MLNQTQIIEYAIKGITAEIAELEKTVREGYRLVRQIENGERAKTTKNKHEILTICRAKNEEIERLDRERFELDFNLNNPE